jgi:hypothetical protein
MSAPPGFNPNASLLPDPGPSAAPIQVMRGGGSSSAQKGGAFNETEMAALAKYQLHTGGVIAEQFNDDEKRQFLNQIADKSRCRRTTGDSIILNKDCWAVVKVIRALLNAKIKKGNLETPSPTPSPVPAPSDPTQQPSVTDVAGEPAAGPAEPAAGPGEPAAGPAEPAAGPGEPAAGPAEPAAGHAEPASGPAEPAAGHAEPTNENIEGLPNNQGNTPQRPSPCKNRKKTQTNGNTNSVESVSEPERIVLNNTVTARGGNNAASSELSGNSVSGASVKAPLTRQQGTRSLVNTRKKKKILFRTTEGLKGTNEERLPGEKNIAYTEANINTNLTPNNKLAAREARGAQDYFLENPDKFFSTAENVAQRERKSKSTSKFRQIKNINKAILTKKYRTKKAFDEGYNAKPEEIVGPMAAQLEKNVAEGRINNTEVPG